MSTAPAAPPAPARRAPAGVPRPAAPPPAPAAPSSVKVGPYLGYLAVGAVLGAVFVQSEVASWYRIQEMFRFGSFHLFGIIGSAIVVSAASLALLRWWGRPIPQVTQPDPVRPRYALGGTVFGLGWGILGACPGPIYALLGMGITSMVVALLSALTGAWAYGLLQDRLPH
ncbi:MAG TPA: DUF6691 family protein [Rubricoccaceae bacterium]|nr:DUF6691 family protein [Rubricoccaceae bacterium]